MKMTADRLPFVKIAFCVLKFTLLARTVCDRFTHHHNGTRSREPTSTRLTVPPPTLSAYCSMLSPNFSEVLEYCGQQRACRSHLNYRAAGFVVKDIQRPVDSAALNMRPARERRQILSHSQTLSIAQRQRQILARNCQYLIKH